MLKNRKAKATRSDLDISVSTVTLNVLGYKEETEWVALALEMDLRGYGATFKEALNELADLVTTQVSFAQFKGQPELIWKPAEPIWFERFADVRREHLNALVQKREPIGSSYDVAGLPLSYIIPGVQSKFVPVEP